MSRLPVLLAALLSLLPLSGWAVTGTATSANVTVDTRDFPEIVVENSAGAALSSGHPAVHTFASVVSVAVARSFTIRNTGAAPLTGIALTLEGADAASFSITAGPAATVNPVSSTSFTVRFLPASTGLKIAALRITNSDADENPFVINLGGRVLSLAEDGDGDGLNDASEFQMSAFGFDWQTAQPALVNTYFAHANGAGLYTAAQVQALHVGTPLMTRDALTGRFKLTLALKKSPALLQPFTALRFDTPQATTVINAQGELEFDFSVPDAAAFFQIEAR